MTSKSILIAAGGVLVLLAAAVWLRGSNHEQFSRPPAEPPPSAPPEPVPNGALLAPPREAPPRRPPPPPLEMAVDANPLQAPKDAGELAKVLNEWASKDESVRDDALSKVHNYLVNHPAETGLRMALHHAVTSDPSEAIRKHAAALFAISGSDESFRFAVERAGADPSTAVKLHAVERLAKVGDADYWVWLTKGGTPEQARERQRGRIAQVRVAFEALGRSSDPEVARAAQSALSRLAGR